MIQCISISCFEVELDVQCLKAVKKTARPCKIERGVVEKTRELEAKSIKPTIPPISFRTELEIRSHLPAVPRGGQSPIVRMAKSRKPKRT